MNEKIVLIKPKNVFVFSSYPPLELLSVGTVLDEKGYDVRIVNAAAEEDYADTLSRECRDALIVGVTCLTSEIESAIQITDMIKRDFAVPVVWGGWHSTLFPVQTCNDKNVDFVIVNEGDYSMLRLVESLAGDGPLSEVPGLVYKKGEKVFVNPTSYVNMEQLSLVKYDLVDIEAYSTRRLNDRFSREENVWLPYQSSRGCPHRCTFCVNTVTNNSKYRTKSPGKVVEEVRTLIARYGITHLRIIDDNFFVDRKRVMEICDGFVNNGFDITWDAECRVDYFRPGHLDDELLDLCTRSGLIELTLGCESGSQAVLDLIKKDITVDEIRNCVKQCHEHNILPRCSFVVGIPGERREDILLTARLVNELRKVEPEMAYGVGTLRPYPGCELVDDLVRKGLFKEPETLREWATKKYVRHYTERTHIQPWQSDPGLANSVSFYYSLAGGVLLANHQIESKLARKVNSLFMKSSRNRTEHLFFGLQFDRHLYDFFHKRYLKRLGAPRRKEDGLVAQCGCDNSCQDGVHKTVR